MLRFLSSSSPAATPSPDCQADLCPILSLPEDTSILTLPEQPLSELEQKMLCELRDKIPELLDDPTRVEKEKEWLNDACLVRYLRAVRWAGIGQAFSRLRKTIDWRRIEKPDEITLDEIKGEAVTGKSFLNGFDKYGRTILIQRPGFENTKNFDLQIRHQIFNIETAIRLSKIPSICVIIDFTQMTLTGAPPLSQTRRFVDILQSHYPEALGLGVMLDPFMIVHTFWKVVSPFIDPKTKEKIVFAYSKQSNNGSHLLNYIDAGQLAACHGGQRPWQWDFDSYWQTLSSTLNKDS